MSDRRHQLEQLEARGFVAMGMSSAPKTKINVESNMAKKDLVRENKMEGLSRTHGVSSPAGHRMSVYQPPPLSPQCNLPFPWRSKE